MITCETGLFPCMWVFSPLSDLISLQIWCECKAVVRAQAPLKRLFVLCVWHGSALCDKARQRKRSRSSWEMTEAPQRHVRVPESFKPDRIEISHIPVGSLRSGSLRRKLEMSIRLQNQIWWTTQSRVKDKNTGPHKECSWSFKLIRRMHCPGSTASGLQIALFWQSNALDDESKFPRAFISMSESTANMLSVVLLLSVMSSGWLPGLSHVMMNE